MKILIISIADVLRVLHNRVHEIIKTLSIKHEVTVWSMNAWYLDVNNKIVELPYNVEVKYLTDKSFHPSMQEIFQTKLIINPKINNEKLNNYDLIINYNMLYLPLLVKLISIKTPIVFDIADDLPALFANSELVSPSMYYLVKRTSKIMLSLNAKISNFISVITPELALKYKLPKNKTFVIPNGVNVAFFRNKCNELSRREIRKKFGIEENTILIGYVGALEKWIDFAPVLSAIKILCNSSNFKLMVVGGGSKLKTLMNLVSNLGLRKCVTFTGTVRYKDIPKYIYAFDIGIAPFKVNEITDTIIPIKLLEYLACGRPVIITPLRSVVNAFKDNVIYAQSSIEYLNALKILSDEDTRKRYGNKGKHIVTQYYDWQKILKRYLSLCERIVQN